MKLTQKPTRSSNRDIFEMGNCPTKRWRTLLIGVYIFLQEAFLCKSLSEILYRDAL